MSDSAFTALWNKYRRLKTKVDKETANNYDRLVVRIDQLVEENRTLHESHAFARQYYHLPQEVYDVFGKLTPSDNFDKNIDRKSFLRKVFGD